VEVVRSGSFHHGQNIALLASAPYSEVALGQVVYSIVPRTAGGERGRLLFWCISCSTSRERQNKKMQPTIYEGVVFLVVADDHTSNGKAEYSIGYDVAVVLPYACTRPCTARTA
jgi:hypothetical protein